MFMKTLGFFEKMYDYHVHTKTVKTEYNYTVKNFPPEKVNFQGPNFILLIKKK